MVDEGQDVDHQDADLYLQRLGQGFKLGVG